MQTTLWKTWNSFPETKYMGSKRAILPRIMAQLARVDFDSVLDAFSGSACVSYALKSAGKKVVSNDFLHFAYHLAKATVENNDVRLEAQDIELLLSRNPGADTFVRDTFAGLYFDETDCQFLDNVRANVPALHSPLKQSLALSALCRACMKKRPRGIFTFTGRRGWDGRRDLRLTMERQFIDAVRLINACIFDNGRENRATCLDVFDTSPQGIDLVYIDTPYLSPHSDSDYTRRYHFLEGLCRCWRGVEIQQETSTKKIKSYPTAFRSVQNAERAFARLFEHFRGCKLAVSYSSNGVPNRDVMADMLRSFKRSVVVVDIPHRYSCGNHRHKVGNNNNAVTEYLFLAT